MKMDWFRMYTEARNDAKLRSLPNDQFRVWFNLLCLAAEQPERGVIYDYDERLLAIEVSGGDTNLLAETCNALQALRCVTCVTSAKNTYEITFKKFDERQTAKPSDQKEKVRERVAKCRKRKASVADFQSKIDVTPRNAPVTPRNAECNAIREEGDSSLTYTQPPTPEQTTEVDTSEVRPKTEREPADLTAVHEAIGILRDDLRTEGLGLELGREHGSADLMGIAGWQWVHAAKKATGSGLSESKRKSFSYFCGIARNTTVDEAEGKPRRREDPTPRKSTPASKPHRAPENSPWRKHARPPLPVPSEGGA